MIGLLSVIEPTTIDEALSDDGWILAMQEELNQFQRNDVWGSSTQTTSEEHYWNKMGIQKQVESTR